MTTSTIPIIDLNPLFSGEANGVQKVATELYQVYSTVGFGLLINHRIPSQTIAELFTASKQFHALSEHEKMQIKYHRHLRGYLPLNSSTLKKSELGEARKPNQSDSYILTNESTFYDSGKWANSVFAGKNVWPAQLPNFQTQVMKYYQSMSALSRQLIQAFSMGLKFPANYLDHYFTDPNIILRLLHYPAIADRPSEDVFGSAPHTDYGCITLLVQDQIGGLQVKSVDDEWLDVPCLPNSIVLNTGQMMTVWSNGQLKSTPHRVICNSQKERFSVPFFYNCNMDVYVEPLPGTVTKEHPLCVEAVTYGEHLEKTVRANYDFGSS
jgi:isopenicillin N synthase-like dioxygenase